MPEAATAEIPKVMEKVFNILKKRAQRGRVSHISSGDNSRDRRSNGSTEGHH